MHFLTTRGQYAEDGGLEYVEGLASWAMADGSRSGAVLIRVSETLVGRHDQPRRALVMFDSEDAPGTPRMAAPLTAAQMHALGVDLIAISGEMEKESR